MKALLTLVERETAWTLVIEPWALALDVPSNARVVVELFDVGEGADQFLLEIAEDGTFLAFDEDRFNVHVGDDIYEFDRGVRL